MHAQLIFHICKCPSGMAINIQRDNFERSTMSIDVESTSTIADVKQHIELLRPVKPSADLILFFEREQLRDDNHTLKACGVEPDSTLLLCKQLKLHIRLPTEKVIKVKILSSVAVPTFVDIIVAKEGLVLSEPQSMFCFFKTSNQRRTLGDCNIESGATLHLTEECKLPFFSTGTIYCITHLQCCLEEEDLYIVCCA